MADHSLRFSTMTSLRHAAREHVAAEPVAVDEARGRVAHGFQPLQAELQHGGQFLAALALVAGLLGISSLDFRKASQAAMTR